MIIDQTFHEIMRAEMRPDCYAGPNCDERAAKWRCSSEGDKGDKGDNADMDVIEIASETFPPGTRVSVSIPVCPDCNLPSDHAMDGTTMGPCPCGFDWVKWAEGQYS